ncbi:HAMP domain-containing histidine kinase, partial [candidate division KSB1 bacterium]|nr:HAMP domain-containing histidine kinase [candidate division KSB1 bacterium]
GLPRFVAIHVRDNGIGIAPNEQHGVFQPFQRGSNVGDIEGSGLGLSICQKIVKQHGGQLAMVSAPGKGTTISFTLPK